MGIESVLEATLYCSQSQTLGIKTMASARGTYMRRYKNRSESTRLTGYLLQLRLGIHGRP